MVDDIFTKNMFFNDAAMRKLKEYRAVVNKLKEKGKKYMLKELLEKEQN